MTDIKTISRRTLVKTGIGALAAPAVLRVLPAQAQSLTIKIGHVSPKTGPLAGFGEADGFILQQVRDILSKGLVNGGKTYKVEIISKDSQSNASRASEVASELILGDKVNLIVASATPDTTNPVADQAEVNEVPCITTNCPWQPYFFGRKGDPKKGFTWTYHFFWGLEDVIGAFLALWDELPTNKVVGGLFPNDADGNAWGDANIGFPPARAKGGFKLVDPGRYQLMNNDFTSQISAFKAAGVNELEPALGKRRREPDVGIAPGIAVGVVGKQPTDHLVGRQFVPQRQEGADHVFQTPEEMIGPGEALLRIALAAEEIRLPRTVGGDAGDLVDLGLVGDRIGGVRRRRGDDQVDLVAEDQFRRHLGSAAGVRLAVL